MRRAEVVLVDTVQSHAQQRGVSRYFAKVVEAVCAAYGGGATIVSPCAADYGRARHVWLPALRRPRINRLIRGSVASVLTTLERAQIYYSPYFGTVATRAAEVYTVYDMIYELFPEHFDRGNPWIRSFIEEKKRCLKRAARILAISHCTAGDIVACYPWIDAAKVAVTPLGVEKTFLAPRESAPKAGRKPYFVYVGNRSGYKNFTRLLEAFASSALAGEFDLLVVSPTAGDWSPAERDSLERLKLRPHVHLVVSPGDESLRRIYRESVALVYPSEYEGFGLPVLEAMASGTIVLCSDRSSLPEVGGTVPIYVDPLEVDAIATGLCEVAGLSESERLARLSEGRRRAQAFTWERCQAETLAQFGQLLDRR